MSIAISLLFQIHGFQCFVHPHKNNISNTVLSYALALHANIYLVYHSKGIGHIKAVCKVLVGSPQWSPIVRVCMEGLNWSGHGTCWPIVNPLKNRYRLFSKFRVIQLHVVAWFVCKIMKYVVFFITQLQIQISVRSLRNNLHTARKTRAVLFRKP